MWLLWGGRIIQRELLVTLHGKQGCASCQTCSDVKHCVLRRARYVAQTVWSHCSLHIAANEVGNSTQFYTQTTVYTLQCRNTLDCSDFGIVANNGLPPLEKSLHFLYQYKNTADWQIRHKIMLLPPSRCFSNMPSFEYTPSISICSSSAWNQKLHIHMVIQRSVSEKNARFHWHALCSLNFACCGKIMRDYQTFHVSAQYRFYQGCLVINLCMLIKKLVTRAA